MKNKTILGIDLGIASIGWALINIQETENIDESQEGKIIDAGVRIFTQAEDAKTGASLALPRRTNRIARRRLRRRAVRLKDLKQLCIDRKIITEENFSSLFQTTADTEDIWSLRARALDEIITGEEMVRILYHIAKRRGFKSTRIAEEEKDKETGQMKTAIKEQTEALKEYRSIADMFVARYKDQAKRNRGGSYKQSVSRDLLQQEIKTIFEAQKSLGNSLFTDSFLQEYEGIAFRQKGIQSVKKMIGKCTFEKNEYRAPKESYSYERFVLLQRINNLRLIQERQERALTDEQNLKLSDLCYKQKKISYKTIRKALNLDVDTKFKGKELKYINKKNKEVDPEDDTFIELTGYHKLKKSLGKKFFTVSIEELDQISKIITYEKEDKRIKKKLEQLNLEKEIIDKLLTISMQKVGHLSFKALYKIIPFLEKGNTYDKACEQAGYNFKNESEKDKVRFLPALSEEEKTTNPVVNRTISQFRKLINAIIRKHGQFDQMNIELSRDIYNNHDERNKIIKMQGENLRAKEEARKEFEDIFKRSLSAKEITKFRLWEEQQNFCVYSGEYMEPNRLIEDGYCQIDHILPYSRSFDDSLSNKVLCLTRENQNKGNRTPFEYFGDTEKWNEFSKHVNQIKSMHFKKRQKLLNTTFQDKETEFKERNLNDTRYMATYIKSYVKDNLAFLENDQIKDKVQVRSGGLTSTLRYSWGLHKDRGIDTHHAQDAIVIACATQGMVQRIAKFAKKDENYRHKISIPFPWSQFRLDTTKAIEKIFVSRKANHKASGIIHEETIRSKKYLEDDRTSTRNKYLGDDKFSTLKTPLEKIKLKDLENLLNLRHGPKESCVVYQILKKRLEEYNDDPKQAFKEPIYMPRQDGSSHSIIRSVKITTTQRSGMPVRGGIADNGSMVRVDVFSKKGKKDKEEFYLIPIYTKDLNKPELPSKFITAGKEEKGWRELDSSFDFKFSLFSNDLVKVKKGENTYFGYYKKTDRANGQIMIEKHNRDNKQELPCFTCKEDNKRISIKTVDFIKKYQVDYLGNYTEIKQERRFVSKAIN